METIKIKYFKKINQNNDIINFYKMVSNGQNARAIEYYTKNEHTRMLSIGDMIDGVFEIDKSEYKGLKKRWEKKFFNGWELSDYITL